MDKNVIEIVIKATDKATDVVGGVIQKVSSSFSGVGKNLLKTGAVLGLAVAPFTAALGSAAKQATTFQESMTNVQAVLGASTEQTAKLSEKILKIGANSRAGPQAAAEAFYDIVGGVADASTHMAILEASIATAEAGSADLAGTTKALISVMNSYSFSANKATYVSDVLTRTVGMGVGSMEEFASALPSVTGLAKTMGISFDELGASVAFLTTKGFTASESATQLRAAMTALLNPNETMLKVFKELGVANGTLLVQQYGLVGALQKVGTASITSEKGLARTLGSVEALNGVLALTGDGADKFFKDFTKGVKGATAAAREIQLQSVAAQMDLLRSSVDALKIAIGAALLPVVNRLVARVRPLVTRVTGWAAKNTRLVTTVAQVIAAVAGLAAGLVALGGVFTAIGVAVGLLANPIAWIVAAVTGLKLAWDSNFMGIRNAIEPVRAAMTNVLYWLQQAYNFGASSGGVFGGITSALQALFYVYQDGKTTFFSNILESFGVTESTAQRVGLAIVGFKDRFVAGFQQVAGFVTGRVLPAFGLFATWFVSGFMPVVVKVITGSVLPAFVSLVNFLARVWSMVQPSLGALATWFVTSGLPSVVTFLLSSVLPTLGAWLDLLGAAWAKVSPSLQQIGSWFVTSGLPAVVGFITDTVVPALSDMVTLIADMDATDLTAVGLALAAWVAPSVLSGIGSLVSSVGTLVASGAGLAASALPLVLIAGLVAALTTNFGGLKDAINQTGQGIRDGDMPQALDGILDALTAIPRGIAEWIGAQIGIDVPAGLKAWKTIISQVGIIVGALPGWVKNKLIELGKTIEEKVQSITDAAMGIGSAIVDGLKSGIENAWGDFTNYLEDKIKGGVVGDVADFLGIGSPSKVFLGFGKNIIEGLKGGIAQTAILVVQLAVLKALVMGVGQQILASAANTGAKIIPAIIGGMTQFGPLATALSQLLTLVNGLGESLNLSGKTLGELMVLGMIAGIYAQWSNLMTAAQQLADAVRSTLRNAFQIRSPSKVFQQMGENMTAGLARGLEQTSPVDHSLRGLVHTLTPPEMTAPLPSGTGGGNVYNNTITIHISADVLTATPDAYQRGRDLAAGIKTELRWNGGGVTHA